MPDSRPDHQTTPFEGLHTRHHGLHEPQPKPMANSAVEAADPIEFQFAVQSVKDELRRRIERNPRYSLRAYARSLGVSHALLSLFLSGKRHLSKKLATQIADRLTCTPDSRLRFIASAQAASKRVARASGAGGGTPPAVVIAPDRTSETEEKFRQLTLDQFQLISEWYFFAILSALELPHAQLVPRWISNQLGISQMEAKLAIEVLKRLQLVEKDPSGRWKQSGAPIRIENTISTAATRSFHHKLLVKAQTALDELPIEKRDFSSVTFAMDPKQLPFAQKRIQEFRRALMKELELRSPNPQAVYHVSIQLFPLTREVPTENPKDAL